MANYQPCPKCQSLGAERMKFTWWGGVLVENIEPCEVHKLWIQI